MRQYTKSCLEQFDMAFAEARSIVGPSETSGISDMQLKNAIWDFYFDVEKSVDWLLGIYLGSTFQ